MPALNHKILLFTFALSYLFTQLIFVATATVTIPPTWHGGKMPPDNCYISFSTTHTFNKVYRDLNNFWFFDNYGFYVANANATITDFFDSDQNILKVAVKGSPNTFAELKIIPYKKGMPRFIMLNQTVYSTPSTSIQTFLNTHSDCWYYDPSNNIIYVKAQLHSTIVVTISWKSPYPPYVTPQPQPQPAPAPTPQPAALLPLECFLILLLVSTTAIIIIAKTRKKKK